MKLAVATDKLDIHCNSITGCQRTVTSVKSSLQQVKRNLNYKVLRTNGISNQITQMIDALEAEARSFGSMSKALRDIKTAYVNMERRADGSSQLDTDLEEAAESSIIITRGSSYSAGELVLEETAGLSDGKDSLTSILSKIIGKAGQAGGLVSTLVNVADPVVNWVRNGGLPEGITGAESVSSFLNGTNSFVKLISEWAESNANLNRLARMLPERAKQVKFERLFGFNDIYKGAASKAGSWSTRFYNNFHKKGGMLDSYTSGGAKSVFAWTGLALSGISNGISNYKEYKSGDISGGRAVAEWALETVIDQGKTWVIGTAVAAGVAATVGSAPVLLVGAATVGVTMGLEYGCKKLTGWLCGEEKGISETISDVVLDVGEAIVETKQKIISGVNDFVKSKFNTFTKGLISVFAD